MQYINFELSIGNHQEYGVCISQNMEYICFFMEGGVYVSCSMKKYTSYFRMVYVIFTMDCCAYNINEIFMELLTLYVFLFRQEYFFQEIQTGLCVTDSLVDTYFFLKGVYICMHGVWRMSCTLCLYSQLMRPDLMHGRWSIA